MSSTSNPESKCFNPGCPQIHFTPRRPDQRYCSDRCKNQNHNDRRKRENNTVYAREKLLRHNQRRLMYVHESGFYLSGVPAQIIKHEKIDLKVYTDKGKNEKTGGTVYWSHNYGIELISKEPFDTYQIHKR